MNKNQIQCDPFTHYVLSSRVLALACYVVNETGAFVDFPSNTRATFSMDYGDVDIKFQDQSLKNPKITGRSKRDVKKVRSLWEEYMVNHYLKDKLTNEQLLKEEIENH